jgi:hypothetical protein
LAGVEGAFRPFLNRLEALQTEYDLGGENILKDYGRIEGRRFVVGKRAYEVVVLPPGTENLDGATVALLAQYLAAGGAVLSFVDGPGRVDGAESNRLSDLAARHASQWLRASSLDDPIAKDLLLTKDFAALSGKLYHQRRRLSDGELLFFVNSSLEAPARAEVTVSGQGLTRFDAIAGEISPYPARVENGRLVFSVELPPAGSLLVVASETVPGSHPVSAGPRAGGGAEVPTHNPLTVKRVAPNVLRIDYCDLKLGGPLQQDLWFHEAMEKVFQHYGFPGNPWLGTQFKAEFLDRDRFPPDSGFEATFRFEIDESVSAGALEAVIERPQLWRVSVNGAPVSARPGAWWLDASFGVYPIGAHLRPGANSITLKAQPMSVHAEIQPIYVLGEFGVAAQPKGFRIVAARELSTGAWKDQGLPFYSDAVVYRRVYEIGPGARPYKIRLGKWLGTVAEVRVNGEPAGIVGWPPYELEVTKYLRSGPNAIEVLVYGSLKNLLGPHLHKYNPGLVGSWLWRYAPEHTPPGSTYDLIGYGLFEDFQLLEIGSAAQ